MLKALLVSYWNPKSNFFLGARISNWRILNFCTKKCEIVPNKTASLELKYLPYISYPQKPPPNPLQISGKNTKKKFFGI